MTTRSASRFAAPILAMMGWITCGRTPFTAATGTSGFTEPGRDASATPVKDGVTSQPVGQEGCPDGFTACGSGAAIRCYDLTRSSDHCGSCANVCAPGIACQASACQQYRCKGTLSYKALALVCPKCAGDHTPALGDFNGDGIWDFVGPTGFNGEMGILLGKGDGTFRSYPVVTSYASPWHAVAADLNGDGWLDLVTVASGDPAISVRLGNGDASTHFAPATTYAASSPVLGLLLADLDNDGHPELVASQDQQLTVWRGSVDGKLGGPVDMPVGAAGNFLASTDWNRDGTPDLLYGGPTLRMMLGHGDGTFDQDMACGISLADNQPFPNLHGTALADFDHDQLVDLVAGSKVVLLGMDGCNFRTLVNLPGYVAGSSGSVAVADLNGDGHADILSAFFVVDRKLQVILGDGQGGFASSTVLSDAEVNKDAVFLAGDFNQDKKLDILATSTSGWRVFLNTCP